eukprot:6014552-Amphidinium_carterae.2
MQLLGATAVLAAARRGTPHTEAYGKPTHESTHCDDTNKGHVAPARLWAALWGSGTLPLCRVAWPSPRSRTPVHGHPTTHPTWLGCAAVCCTQACGPSCEVGSESAKPVKAWPARMPGMRKKRMQS